METIIPLLINIQKIGRKVTILSILLYHAIMEQLNFFLAYGDLDHKYLGIFIDNIEC